MIRTQTINDLAGKLGDASQGRIYFDIIPAAALLASWSVFHACDTHEERLRVIEAMEAFMRQELLDLQTYTEQKKEKEEHETANTA